MAGKAADVDKQAFPSCSEGTVPRDSYRIFYFLIFFLGLVGHLPWNAMITTQPFFQWRLRETLPLWNADFIAHFAIIFKAIKFAVFSTISLYKLPVNNQFMIAASTAGNVLVFAGMAGLVTHSTMTASSFYSWTIISVTAAAVFLACFECGMYAILGTFPARLTQAFLAGNAIGGVLSSLNLIVSFYSSKADISVSTHSYFLVAVAMFVAALVVFFVFLNSAYYKFYQKRLAFYQVMVESGSGTLDGSKSINRIRPDCSLDDFPDKPAAASERLTTRPSPLQSLIQRVLPRSTVALIEQLKGPAASLFITGAINILIHPTLIAMTDSTARNSPHASVLHRDLFVPVAYLIASLSDFAGRLVPFCIDSSAVTSSNSRTFLLYSLLRLFFIPAFLFGNLKVHGLPLLLPHFLAHNGLFFFLIVAAFLSGSFLVTSLLASSPKRVDVAEQSRATILLGAILQLGVFFGSIVAVFLSITLRQLTVDAK